MVHTASAASAGNETSICATDCSKVTTKSGSNWISTCCIRGCEMATRKTKTTGLRVRMYRVGFGDFFLVIVPTPSGDQHILIDCGVFKGTSGTGDLGSITDAVEDMFQATNGRLALVIMNHRHADHIARFKVDCFKDFNCSMLC